MRIVSLMVLLVSLALSGCGSSTQKVSGQVTFNGQPVTGGSLTFLPKTVEGSQEAGKPATATVGSDGKYVLGTEKADDGARVGRYQVSYSAPVAEMPAGVELKPGQSPPPSPFDKLVPKQPEVEVKTGANAIDVELTKPTY